MDEDKIQRRNELARKNYARNPERRKATALKRFYILKRKAFAVLNDECNWCQENDTEILEIDHVYGDGYLSGKNRGGQSVCIKVLANPEHFQLLCANCHTRKTKYDNKK